MDTPEVKSQLKNKGDLSSIELTVISDSPDSEVATLFEILDSDASDFFFGGKLHFLSEDEMKESRKLMKRPH